MAVKLTVLGVTVRAGDDELYCLNDFHKAAGGLKKDAPNEWTRLDKTKKLIEKYDKPGFPGLKKTRGRHAGTYACEQLVYAYVSWISPEFYKEVLDCFTMLVQRRIDEAIRIASRQVLRDDTRDMTDALKDNIERQGKEVNSFCFSSEHNMIYKIVLGMTFKEYTEEHQCDNVRDNISLEETHAILDLQREDEALNRYGATYDQRKEALQSLFDKKHKHKTNP